MKYNKAAIITPKHTAFVWNKNKQQMSIPDEYANNIKHVYLAKDFTCILNLNNEAVCIKDESDTIVHTQSNVDKIVCEEKFMCYVLTDGSFECKEFEDKQKVLIPQFPDNIKMVDLEIKIIKNFNYYYGKNEIDSYKSIIKGISNQKLKNFSLKNQIYKQKNGEVQIPYVSDQNQGQQEYFKIVYCVIGKIRKIDCWINIAIADCNDCNQSIKVDFGLQVQADEYIINDYSICLRDHNQWQCQSQEIQLDPSNISLTKISYIQNTYPSKFTYSQINKFQNESLYININDYPSGVQHDLPFSNFSNWEILQKADWGQTTHTSDIDKDIDSELMFVGAQKKSSNDIYIGAQGLKNNIISRTNSQYQANEQKNGVQWQYVENRTFGFSNTQRINLTDQGQFDYNDSNSSDKLSFSLFQNYTGGRAGSFHSTSSDDWVKIIQYLPKITNDVTDHESKYVLDRASDGESSCELGDALEISCQNFPKPISLQRDTVKQATQKQIDEQIEYYKLKQDDTTDDSKKEDDKADYNEEIENLIEEVQKLENQSDSISKLQKNYDELNDQKDKLEKQSKQIENITKDIENLKNSDQTDSNSDDVIIQLKSSIQKINTKQLEIENKVDLNISKIESKEPISEDQINKIKSELSETKVKLKKDLSTDADVLFDEKIKNKIISDEYLNKILDLSLENKLNNINSSINSIKTKVIDLEEEINNQSSESEKSNLNEEFYNKIIEVKVENEMNNQEITELNKKYNEFNWKFNQIFQSMIILFLVQIVGIIYQQFNIRNNSEHQKIPKYSTNQQIDLRLDDESSKQHDQVNRLN